MIIFHSPSLCIPVGYMYICHSSYLDIRSHEPLARYHVLSTGRMISGMQCHTCIRLMLSLELSMFILVVFLSCSSLTIVLAGTTEQVVQAYDVWHRVAGTSTMSHKLSYVYAYARAYVTKKPHVHARLHMHTHMFMSRRPLLIVGRGH